MSLDIHGIKREKVVLNRASQASVRVPTTMHSLKAYKYGSI